MKISKSLSITIKHPAWVWPRIGTERVTIQWYTHGNNRRHALASGQTQSTHAICPTTVLAKRSTNYRNTKLQQSASEPALNYDYFIWQEWIHSSSSSCKCDIFSTFIDTDLKPNHRPSVVLYGNHSFHITYQ